MKAKYITENGWKLYKTWFLAWKITKMEASDLWTNVKLKNKTETFKIVNLLNRLNE